MLVAGVRVVRGPDWSWDNQDGGEGHVGTVCQMSKSGSVVKVQWDNGTRTMYNVGYLGKYCLRVIDNVQIGVQHANIICGGCSSRGINGIRFKCTTCHDYDLCNVCYHGDKHNVLHSFKRFDSATSSGIDLPTRANLRKCELRGIFPGAKVVRGFRWKWGNQDGGEGKIGSVLKICGWGGKSSRSAVKVQWHSGSTHKYRLGHKGKCDIRFIESSTGGYYYPDHLPVLEPPAAISVRKHGPPPFVVGEAVKVETSEEQLKVMQQRHGGWNPRMSEFIGKVGTVHRVIDKGHITVKFEERSNLWVFNPSALYKVNSFAVGDVVTFIMDVEKVTELQKGRGGWIGLMRNSLGKMGKVLKIYTNGDLRVQFDDHTWTLHPQCVRLIPDGHTEFANTMHALQNQKPPFVVGEEVKVETSEEQLKVMQQGHGGWNPIMSEFIGKVGTVHRVIDKGHITVKFEECSNLWKFNPSALYKVNSFAVGDVVTFIMDVEKVTELQKGRGGWTGLMRNSLGKMGKVLKIYTNGYLRVQFDDHTWTLHPQCVRLIPDVHTEFANTMHALQNQIQCSPGNQAICSNGITDEPAAQGHLEVVKSLLETLSRNTGKTALHVAAHRGYFVVVKFFLQIGAQVNAADEYGNTCLHYAAFGNQPKIMELIVKSGVDLNATQRMGCTALHIAAQYQPARCLQILIAAGADPNCRDSFGNTALHGAIGKDNFEAIEMLCMAQGTDFTLRNKRGFNVLHHAAVKGKKFATITLLRVARQLVDVKKDDGFSALHLAALNGRQGVVETLILEGKADIELRNNRKQTALILAVSKGHCNVIDTLVRLKANLNAEDENGDTALRILRSKNPAMFKKYNARIKVANMSLDRPKEGYNLADVFKVPSSKPTLSERKNPPAECLVCSELSEENVELEPCHHKPACEDCSSIMKKCLHCGVPVTRRVTKDGRVILLESREPIAKRMRYLECKIAEIEESLECSVCLEQKRNVVFLCGHGTCSRCADILKTCPICRKAITNKIRIY